MKFNEKNIKAAIFDLDGTLLDSTKMWQRLAVNYVASLGKTPRERLSERVWELSTEAAAGLIKAEYSLAQTREEIVRDLLETAGKFYREKARLKSGAEKLLRELYERGTRLALATASQTELAKAALERAGVLPYFSAFLSCEEYGEKSSPEIFLAAAEMMLAKPCETAVFEDSLTAAKTAKSAGFYVCAVYDESEKNQAALRETADKYLVSYL